MKKLFLSIFAIIGIALGFVACSDDEHEPVTPPQGDEVESPYPSAEELYSVGEGYLWLITRAGTVRLYTDTGDDYNGLLPETLDGEGCLPYAVYFKDGNAILFYGYDAMDICFKTPKGYDPKTGYLYKSTHHDMKYINDFQVMGIDDEKMVVRFSFANEIYEDGSVGERVFCTQSNFYRQPDGDIDQFLENVTFITDPELLP